MYFVDGVEAVVGKRFGPIDFERLTDWKDQNKIHSYQTKTKKFFFFPKKLLGYDVPAAFAAISWTVSSCSWFSFCKRLWYYHNSSSVSLNTFIFLLKISQHIKNCYV